MFTFKKNDSLEQRHSALLNFQVRNILETKNYNVIEAEIPNSIY
jgi:hypothetical protein